MLRAIVSFEWRYHTRQITFAAGALLFLSFGFILPATSYGAPNLAINSPYLIMQSMAFLSLLSVFAAGVFAANAVLRDPEHRMEEIVHCTPVGRFHFLAGRFIGAFLTASTVAAFSIPGMLAGTAMPWLDPARVAPVDVLSYLWAFGVAMLPNVLFATVLLLAVAVLTRNALATYAASVVIYVLYFVVAALSNSPLMAASRAGVTPPKSLSLLDPFALTAFFDLTRYWVPAVKNSRMIPLEGVLLYNRLFWIAAALAVAAFVYHRFSFRARNARPRSRASRPQAAEEPIAVPAMRPRPALRPSLLASYWSATRIELRVLRSVPAVLLLLVWTALAASEIQSHIGSGEYGTRLLPMTSLVVSTVETPLSIVGLILLMYYAAEMFWREQRHRIAAILDCTPVNAGVMVAAKWTGMAALIAAVIVGAIVPGVVLQVANGYWNFEPLVYLSLFYFSGVPLLLFATAALLVHSFSPGKYAGLMLVLIAAMAVQIAPQVGLAHPLWRFAVAPPVRYSDMNGFGHDPVVFHWLVLYWAAIGGMFVLVASAVWRRVGRPLRERLSAAARIRRGPLLAAAAVALTSGGWIFYNTNVLNTRQSLDALNDWKAAYEKTYRSSAPMPQPRVQRIVATIDLDPQERHYRAAGEYELVNDTSVPIRTVLVSTRREAEQMSVAMPAARGVTDARFGMTRFELARPLAPGARTTLRFDLRFARHGFTDEEPNDTIVRNGSFLLSFQCLPGIGYRAGYELQDPMERRKRGLAPPSDGEDVEEGPSDGAKLARVDLDLTVSTSADQTAVAPGRLVRSWQEHGRRYFHYVTETPIFDRFAIASARYAVARRNHHGIDVALFHHPAHRINAERALDIGVAALDYCQRHYGPYPARQLRLAEIPSYWPFGAFAMPETVFLVENRSLNVDPADVEQFDLLTRRVAHEVAHQWWGHTLAPASVPGATVLVETVTKYTDMAVLEQMRGRDQVRMLREMELDHYLAGRAHERDTEPPLYLARSQAYLYYSKGSLALYAIGERIGRDRLDLALRNLMAEYRDRGGVATTRDLLRHLHRAAGGEHAAFIDEWLQDVVLNDFSIRSADAEARADGRYDVTIAIDVAKRRADSTGHETALPFRDPVEIAVRGIDGAPVHRAKHQLHEGRNVIRLAVSRRPARVAVDPDLLFIDTNLSNNSRKVGVVSR